MAGAVAALLALPAVAQAAPRDFVTGAGDVGGFAHVTVSVHQQSDGSVSGHLSFDTEATGRVYADATCIRVNGKDAVVGGTVRDPDPIFNIQGMAYFIRDNGTPSALSPDELSPLLSPSTQGLCDLQPDTPFIPLTSGNLLVMDR